VEPLAAQLDALSAEQQAHLFQVFQQAASQSALTDQLLTLPVLLSDVLMQMVTSLIQLAVLSAGLSLAAKPR